MRLLLSLLLLLPLTLSQAADIYEYPTLPKKVTSLNDFVPAGWKLVAEAKGDLNRDTRDDYVFVIESLKKYDSKYEDGKPYGIRVAGIALWNTREKNFELIVQANDFIPSTEGNPAITEDPLESVLVKNGTARFYFHYMDNSQLYITDQTFIFYYNKDRVFELGGFVRSKLHRSTQGYTRESINFTTGKSTLLKRDSDSEIGATSDVNFTPERKYFFKDMSKVRAFKPQVITYSEFAGTY